MRTWYQDSFNGTNGITPGQQSDPWVLKLARPTSTGEITDEVYADWTTTYPELDGRSKAQVAQFPSPSKTINS